MVKESEDKQMSMFDNREKDDLFDEASRFLETHSISTLLYIIYTAIRYKLGEDME